MRGGRDLFPPPAGLLVLGAPGPTWASTRLGHPVGVGEEPPNGWTRSSKRIIGDPNCHLMEEAFFWPIFVGSQVDLPPGVGVNVTDVKQA